MPLAGLQREVRVAFAGRTSTEEQQDPRQSMIRQLERAKSTLPESWMNVAHFYDVESGRKELDQRGHGADVSRFDIPIPRDGGIDDLLAEAEHRNCRFDAVICESMSRIVRRMYENLTIERQLEQAGVALLAWNEPIKVDGPRAAAILHRRINQSVAEYEAFQTLESSWGGLCTHVRDGWNIGKPPYGYRAKNYRHPNSAKADRGATKTRLEPDDARGETVTQIAHWRYYRQLGYGAIADALNADPERYPPPEPVGGAYRARGAWGKSTVADLLRNPKYTGYQVFNRRASRSRHGAVNGPEKWVWSEQPVHEPLIPKWMFDEFNAHRQDRRGSRQANTLNRHPATKRTYVFRGRSTAPAGGGCSATSARPAHRSGTSAGPERTTGGATTSSPTTPRPSVSAKTSSKKRSPTSTPNASSAAAASLSSPRTSPATTTAPHRNAPPNEPGSRRRSTTSPAGKATSCGKPRTATPTTRSPKDYEAPITISTQNARSPSRRSKNLTRRTTPNLTGPDPKPSSSSTPYRNSPSSSTRHPKRCNDASTRSPSSPSTSITRNRRYT